MAGPASADREPGRAAPGGPAVAVEIVTPGPFATVQDLGRPGLAHLGVTRSGAADRPSLRLANRLVGNLESAATIEVTYGGLAARFPAAALIALSGAPCPLSLDGRQIGMYAPVDVPAGALLRIGPPERGLRTYLAVRGGFDVAPVLGSRSTDTLSGIGPAPLRAGQRLRLGDETTAPPIVDLAPQPRYVDEPILRVVVGPRDDHFAADALPTLCSAAYEVTSHSDRVGARLAGPALRRRIATELPSEAMVVGSLQIPPDGQPVLFLSDHPVTGGYPVLAVVATADLPLAAQCRPGQRLRFQRVSPAADRARRGFRPGDRPQIHP